MEPIYLDYASTTPIDSEVIKAMNDCMMSRSAFGNPSSAHHHGWEAEELIETAYVNAATMINGVRTGIVWTSGATESNNTILKGIARGPNTHIITSKIEHNSILGVCQYLESQGVDVTYISPNSAGWIEPKAIKEAIRPETRLVSIMHVNNETGVINPISDIGHLIKTLDQNILFHVDAAQSGGKLIIDVQKMNIDFLSLSAHKMYGPKGIGILYVSPDITLPPLIHGSGHQRNRRAGTLPTHQIIGMGEACRLNEKWISKVKELSLLKDRLLYGLRHLDDVYINGKVQDQTPYIVNVCFAGVDGRRLAQQISGDISVSVGSACLSDSTTPSHVLRAMRIPDELIKNSIRFSFGKCTYPEQIDTTVGVIVQHVTQLRRRS